MLVSGLYQSVQRERVEFVFGLRVVKQINFTVRTYCLYGFIMILFNIKIELYKVV